MGNGGVTNNGLVMEDTIQLHYHSADDSQHLVPSEVLCKLVDSLNVLAYLTASSLYAQNDRGALTYGQFRQDYAVSCAPPRPGSFILPISISKLAKSAVLDPKLILDGLFAALFALGQGTVQGTPLNTMTQEHRNHFASQLVRMVPESGSAGRLSIEFLGDEVRSVQITDELASRASASLRSDDVQGSVDVASVIGELVSVDFVRHILVLKLPKLDREIECCYGSDTPIGLLFEGRISRLQVVGAFEFDAEGDPVRCVCVSSLCPVDLTPIVVREFRVSAGRVVVDGAPILFIPKLDEDTLQLYVVEDESLGIDVFSYNRKELFELVVEQLSANWAHYACSDDAMLDEQALVIKNGLLAAFRMSDPT